MRNMEHKKVEMTFFDVELECWHIVAIITQKVQNPFSLLALCLQPPTKSDASVDHPRV